MEPKDTYTLRDLYNDLDIPLTELGRRAGISDVTLAKIRDGASARRSTINSLLRVFSQIYGVKLSTDNVEGIIIKDKLARKEEAAKHPAPAPAKTPKAAAEKPQKRTYKPREVDLPEGCLLATDFAKMHGVAPTTFRDHMLIGLGPGTVQGGQGGPMLPVKEQVDYSERDHPSRKGERERYLTPAQQTATIEFWKRHGVAFTVPESEQEAPADESWWTEPGAE
jgi:hypothetical protein